MELDIDGYDEESGTFPNKLECNFIASGEGEEDEQSVLMELWERIANGAKVEIMVRRKQGMGMMVSLIVSKPLPAIIRGASENPLEKVM